MEGKFSPPVGDWDLSQFLPATQTPLTRAQAQGRPQQPGISFMDRADQAAFFKLHLPWVLRTPDVSAAIVGASRPEQLEDDAKASGLAVDPAVFAAAERLFA